jgi:DNA polymerase alpha subunit A
LICADEDPRRTEDGSGEPPGSSLPQGLLPEVIRSLVERRREVKKLMGQAGKEKGGKDSLEYKQYDIRQLALKLVANRYSPTWWYDFI